MARKHLISGVIRLSFIALIAIVSFCCKHRDPIDDPKPQDTTQTPVDTTRLPTDTTVTPIDTTAVYYHIQSVIDQALPMTGLVLWVDNARELDATYRKSISMEFAYCLPCRVVKGKTDGVVQYDWSSFDAMLDDIASREHQAIVRFRYEYPSSTDVDGKKGTTAVPDYIKALPDYNETYSKNPGGDGPTYYADWSNSELQWFTKQFYTDFCDRYAHDKRLAFLEVGFGHWSEYHIYGTKIQFGKNFPTKEYQEEFFNHMNSVADGLPWCVSIDAADEEYSPVADDKSLLGLRFGLFDDSFMHEGHEIGSSDGWNEQLWNIIGGNRWQTSPCGGEISYYSDKDQRNFLNPSGLYGITWEQAAAKYHISFMIANDATEGSYGTAERFLQAAHASGYRFEITEVRKLNETLYVQIRNNGIAPIYRPAYVEVNGIRNEYNMMQLLPYSSVLLEFSIGNNDNIDIAIVSDYTLINIPYEAKL